MDELQEITDRAADFHSLLEDVCTLMEVLPQQLMRAFPAVVAVLFGQFIVVMYHLCSQLLWTLRIGIVNSSFRRISSILFERAITSSRSSGGMIEKALQFVLTLLRK